ncbi:cyclin-dependent kinase-like 4 [Diachasma alloeum]|uniref:cyclin-dependent kinase-like 4 n=1 Tax=Diachasma alloeum TaxID=454923 RepID=UPI00073817D6|nr:cyclin-dependent kinase-like 4 [Diachasma alloeum]
MDKYENIEVVGEGSYGIVMKCKHRDTGQIVAIKKFLETEEDVHVRKMAYREIRMLKKLHHDNLVKMIEVFRRRKRFYLVFEYLDHTVLDELEAASGGLGPHVSKRHIFQVVRGLNFCHTNHIMHRDVKPENILVSPNGVIKLCDFGFARFVSGPNESCTDYVATRWYRAPELLVGDSRYGRPVDVWALGCLYAEMVTGDPLFPGESDVDQLFQITKVLGGLCSKHQAMINRGFSGFPNRLSKRSSTSDDSHSNVNTARPLRSLFPKWAPLAIDFLSHCLRLDPEIRPSCATLLQHQFFTHDGFAEKFVVELERYIAKESGKNSLIAKRMDHRKTTYAAETPRICYGSAGRWRMQLIKETGSFSTKPEFEECVPDGQNPQIFPQSEISVPTRRKTQREPLYVGPISVTPNTTYIRRLDMKGALPPDSKNFSLPALPSKEKRSFKRETKRHKDQLY